jgi:hypothetical protein
VLPRSKDHLRLNEQAADSLFVLLVISVVSAICLVPLLGGRLRGLASLRFRWMPLLATGVLTQFLALSEISHLPDIGRAALEIGSYASILVFLIVNRRVPGFILLIAGGASNGLVITANAGVMPATAHALSEAGQQVHPAFFSNSAVVADPHLPFLGDVFWIPKALPFANVFSVGDVLIAIGAVVTIHIAAGSRLGLGLRGPRAEDQTVRGPLR